MSHNSLYPAFVRINYTTQFAPHLMTIPTTMPTLVVTDWQFDAAGGHAAINVSDAVEAWVEVIRAYYPTGTVFTDAILFTMDDPVATPTPVFSFPLNLAGLDTPSGGEDFKATQGTFTFRTDQGGIFKIVLLDVVTATWEKITDRTAGSVASIVDYILDDQGWMTGRDGGVPVVFLQKASTLNERLRRSYRMN